MFALFKKVPQLYYTFWLNLLNLKKRSKILPIDFEKHWTQIIFSQKKHLAIILVTETVIEIFYTLIPYILGLIVETGSIVKFFILLAAWIIAIAVQYISAYSMTILETQCIASVQYNAYQFFLTTDPINHFERASGKLFTKIERGARAFEGFIDIVLYDLGPTLVSIVTAIIMLLLKDLRLGFIALSMLCLIAIINILLNLITGTAFEPNLIAADDALKTISVESLTQVQLVRSSFASNQLAKKVHEQNTRLLTNEGTSWLALSATFFITRLIYLISIGFLGYAIIRQILTGVLTSTLAVTLLLTYMRGTYQIITIGRKLRKLIRSVSRINDLYLYIRSFGDQTFPVLAAPKGYTEAIQTAKQEAIIAISITNLSFDYNTKAKIFENHQLNLRIPKDQPNKLYGIIGPSGMGKTTLLSILGGQLKPDTGNVLLNGINIYAIDDHDRQKLIALQGQVASSLSGTLRTTLLLGLPNTPLYTDEHIINILEKVGLWHIFAQKDGLDTFIGEAGLTLSGGQRQRLSFAALYLRAQHYKPLLILIDEPTSSLDPVSEKAITQMISELAQYAVTFVIAHRIHTLDNAHAILDFSLISIDKDITFYTKNELEQYSAYYKRLLSGQTELEDI